MDTGTYIDDIITDVETITELFVCKDNAKFLAPEGAKVLQLKNTPLIITYLGETYLRGEEITTPHPKCEGIGVWKYTLTDSKTAVKAVCNA